MNFENCRRLLTDGSGWFMPAYDLGYLLRKLPKEIDDHFLAVEICSAHENLEWTADYLHYPNLYLIADEPKNADLMHADIPEDAAAKLAIELFREGILVKAA